MFEIIGILVLVAVGLLFWGLITWVFDMLGWMADTPRRSKRHEQRETSIAERLERIEQRLDRLEEHDKAQR